MLLIDENTLQNFTLKFTLAIINGHVDKTKHWQDTWQDQMKEGWSHHLKYLKNKYLQYLSYLSILSYKAVGISLSAGWETV